MVNFYPKDAKTRSAIAVFLAKFWMILASIGVAVNLIIVLTLLQMAPKLKIIAQILPSSETTKDTSNYAQIDTLPLAGLLDSNSNINKKNRALLDEMFVRYYLDMRISRFSDPYEMASRWTGAVRRLSSPIVYRNFLKQFEEGLEQELKNLKEEKETTSIDIISISSIGKTYSVEYDVYTYLPLDPVPKPRVQRFIATIEIDHRPHVHNYNMQESNPYGFYVKKYRETVKRK